MQLARAHATALYMDLVMTYCHNPERWASAKSTVLAAGRLALPYCLQQLSGWLACGGMALGAHPFTRVLARRIARGNPATAL